MDRRNMTLVPALPKPRKGEMTSVGNILPNIFPGRFQCMAQHPTKAMLQYRDRQYRVFSVRKQKGNGPVELYHRAPKDAWLDSREYQDLIRQATMDFIAKDAGLLNNVPLSELQEPEALKLRKRKKKSDERQRKLF